MSKSLGNFTTIRALLESGYRRAADAALLAALSSVGYEDEEAAAAAAATVAVGIARAVAAAAAEGKQQAAAVRIQAAQRGRAARSHVHRKRAARSEQSR